MSPGSIRSNRNLGQHNDSRMNMALIMSAVKHGAIVANYCEVTELNKGPNGKINGVLVKDNLTGEEWNIRTKVNLFPLSPFIFSLNYSVTYIQGVINATGPFSDALLTLDNPSHTPIVQPSSGVHITLPNYYSPRKMGLLDPATSDGRVIFFLPWQGNTIAGTTDTPAMVSREPRASEEDIRWLLEEVRNYLSPDIKVRRGDVLSAWSGLRPLVRNPGAASTEGLVRNHMIHVSDSGLLTIAGGKWTTYRAMAEETIDTAIKTFGLSENVKNGCITDTLRLVGSDGWSRNMFIGLIQTVNSSFVGVLNYMRPILTFTPLSSMVLKPMWRDTFLTTTAIVHGQCVLSLNRQAKAGLCTENDWFLHTHVSY
jgi:glycerol-3-phosphate dehydrogenase